MEATGPLAKPIISVVVPVFDERGNLDPLAARLTSVLETTTSGAFEVILVDDGSRDGSAEMLDEVNRRDPRFKIVHLSRNFGHQAALQAGLDMAVGDAVVLMDGDLQDPPEVIPDLVATWRQGYEVVYGIRKNRQESVWKRAAYHLFYRTLRLMSDVDTPRDAGDFCLMDRRVVTALLSMPERSRFLRGLRTWVGFRQTGIEYQRRERHAGEPKYTLGKLLSLAVSGYVGFSTVPLRLATWAGILTAAAGFMTGIWVVVTRFIQPGVPRGWASTNSLILFVGGMQLIVLGIIGEYLARVYQEVRSRPLYVIRSRTGFPDESHTTKNSKPTREIGD